MGEYTNKHIFLSDFNIASPTANHILQYISGKWVTSTLSFTTTLAGDTDVNITSLTSGQVLQYNGSKWINSTLSMGSSTLASDSDVSLSSLINGQLLKYNGRIWINYTPTYIYQGVLLEIQHMLIYRA